MANYIKLTRPDGGKVFMRRDGIDKVLQVTKLNNTEVYSTTGVQSVRESAEDIMRDLN